MITRADAELLVAAWADEAGRREGGEWTGRLAEFEHGFVVWVVPVGGVPAEPGSGVRRVIDRETGEIIPWGSIPAPVVAEQYRRHRRRVKLGVPTVDPVARIRWQTARPWAPTTAAQLRLAHDRRLRTAYGARGDQTLDHHPLVREWLDAQPRGHLARGTERHAEIVLISDTLHAYDAGTGQSAALEQARELFRRPIEYRLTRIRDAASGGGRPAWSCYSCLAAFVHFGLFGPDILVRFSEVENAVRAEDRPDFPPELVPFLAPGGLIEPITPGRPATSLDDPGHDPSAPLPQAGLEVCRRYRSSLHHGSVPGEVHRSEDLFLWPGMLKRYRPIAAEFGRYLGVVAYPLGEENSGEGIILGDEHGRVFLLDQSGEWFLGSDIDEALINLLYGREQVRLRDDRTW